MSRPSKKISFNDVDELYVVDVEQELEKLSDAKIDAFSEGKAEKILMPREIKEKQRYKNNYRAIAFSSDPYINDSECATLLEDIKNLRAQLNEYLRTGSISKTTINISDIHQKHIEARDNLRKLREKRSINAQKIKNLQSVSVPHKPTDTTGTHSSTGADISVSIKKGAKFGEKAPIETKFVTHELPGGLFADGKVVNVEIPVRIYKNLNDILHSILINKTSSPGSGPGYKEAMNLVPIAAEKITGNTLNPKIKSSIIDSIRDVVTISYDIDIQQFLDEKFIPSYQKRVIEGK